MPAKIARSAPRPPFELPKVMVAVRTSPLSCWKAGKTRIFTPVRESSGKSRIDIVGLSAVDPIAATSRRVLGNVGATRGSRLKLSSRSGFVAVALLVSPN